MINSETQGIKLLDFRDRETVLKTFSYSAHGTYESMEIISALGYPRAASKQERGIIFK